MNAALVTLGACFLGYVLFVLWLLRVLSTAHERERTAWHDERRDLLLRIASPQTAAAMDYNQAADENPPAVDMSDGPTGDESYWLSREELAEKAAEEEIARG
jgi:hypothetical protein